MSNVAFRRAVKSVRISPKFNDEEEMALMQNTTKKKNSKRIDYFAYTLALLSSPLRNLCLRGEISFT